MSVFVSETPLLQNTLAYTHAFQFLQSCCPCWSTSYMLSLQRYLPPTPCRTDKPCCFHIPILSPPHILYFSFFCCCKSVHKQRSEFVENFTSNTTLTDVARQAWCDSEVSRTQGSTPQLASHGELTDQQAPHQLCRIQRLHVNRERKAEETSECFPHGNESQIHPGCLEAPHRLQPLKVNRGVCCVNK